MNDLISRSALMKEFSDFVRRSNNSDFAPTPTWNDAVSLVESMPPAQPINVQEAYYRGKAVGIKECMARLKKVNEEIENKLAEQI